MTRRTRTLRRASALIAVLSAAVLAIIGPTSPAHAADTTDQITGGGQTDSAVTASWSEGLLGADNQTVVTPRDPNSPLAFMSDDFKNLKVTVSQTKSLVHQAVTVNWTGGQPTEGNFQGGFLQIMQCYGDKSTGPDPEDCEYGSFGMSPPSSIAENPWRRSGLRCVDGATPSTDQPAAPANGNSPGFGCDPAEPVDPSHLDPSQNPSDQAQNYTVPFVPVGTDQKIYNQEGATDSLLDYFSEFNSNEIQAASTGPDGTGQQFFQTLTGTEAPGLGCGQPEDSGSARGCWLVVVPRGQYEPNGWKIGPDSTVLDTLNESPLGASSWAQRIQIHLDFAPIGSNCPLGSAQERDMVGTELVSHAVFSWQLALNQAAKCKSLYGFAGVPQATSITQLSTAGGAGLAFTTVPIAGGANGPPLVYAPVSVSAITFGFNIDEFTTGGYLSTPIKLTPRLMAKALTQSYKNDLVDFIPSKGKPGPTWAKNNAQNITTDPEFLKLNPEISPLAAQSTPLQPLLTEDHSAVNQQVWAWIQSDPSARKWLEGAPDEDGMVVNPDYQKLNLGEAPAIDSYPRADPTCVIVDPNLERPPGKCSLDLLPYVNNLDDAASHVRAANDPTAGSWDPMRVAADGSSGAYAPVGIEPVGQRFMWAVTDSADLAAYGLVPAQLCHADGTDCVSPDTSTVSSALAGGQAGAGGLVQIDPAKVANNAYPLVDVAYAAVRTTQDPAALQDFATLIDYAAGPGQTAGVAPGQLPRGYLPLTSALKAQASAAATTLRTDATAPPPTSASVTATRSTSSPLTDTPTSATAPPPAPSSAAQGPVGPATSATSAPAPTANLSSSGPGISYRQAPVALAAQTTPGNRPGPIRWALLTVVAAGLVGALSGPLTKAFGFIRRAR